MNNIVTEMILESLGVGYKVPLSDGSHLFACTPSFKPTRYIGKCQDISITSSPVAMSYQGNSKTIQANIVGPNLTNLTLPANCVILKVGWPLTGAQKFNVVLRSVDHMAVEEKRCTSLNGEIVETLDFIPPGSWIPVASNPFRVRPPVGAQGIQGFQGSVGYQGSIGVQGWRGNEGFQGRTGLQGRVGPTRRTYAVNGNLDPMDLLNVPDESNTEIRKIARTIEPLDPKKDGPQGAEFGEIVPRKLDL